MRATQIFFACALLTPALLAGCAGAPPTDRLATLPVVNFGETAPAGQEFILHYPAGAPLAVVASVSGSLMREDVQAPLTARTNRDVYLYQNWISFDGKSWVYGPNAVKGEFRMELPGQKTGKEPGALASRFDLK